GRLGRQRKTFAARPTSSLRRITISNSGRLFSLFMNSCTQSWKRVETLARLLRSEQLLSVRRWNKIRSKPW
ncbi:hypothetical protein PMAYCL1PPCAC_27946, partial [Pristionchus mayeri]